MVSKAALDAAKAIFGKQLCRYGGYRKQCPNGEGCLNHHYDDENNDHRSNTNKCNLASPLQKRDYKMKLRTRGGKQPDINEPCTEIVDDSSFHIPRQAETFPEGDEDDSDSQKIERAKESPNTKIRKQSIRSNYYELRTKVLHLNGVYGNSEDYVATGLRNIGNWCYMNSSLQCLIRSDKLLEMLLTKNNDELPNYSERRIVDEIRFLANVIKSGEYRSVTPADMKRSVDKNLPKFLGTSQHDAHEFLTCVLDRIKEELTEESPSLKIEYEGHYKSVVICKQCNNSSQGKVEPYNSIHVDIPEVRNPSLVDGLKKLVESDKIEDYECEKCPAKGPAMKTITFEKLPDVLIVQIKRFKKEKYGLSRKDSTEIKIPSSMTLEDNKNTSHIYELTSFVDHFGTTNGGHYTACCKDMVSDVWYHCNDSRVEQVLNLEEEKRKAYILFYKKIDVIDMGDDSDINPVVQEVTVSATISQVRKSNRESKPSQKSVTAKTPEIDTADLKLKKGGEKMETKNVKRKNDVVMEMEKSNGEVERFCLCDKPNDGRTYMECNMCKQWFHPKCVSFKCGKCTNEKIRKLDETIQNLQKNVKTRNSEYSASQSSVKNLEKELEKSKKENNRLRNEIEKKETKYKKDLDSAAEKLNSEKLKSSKNTEEKEKSHEEQVANLKKELENRKREIDIHVKKIVELQEENLVPVPSAPEIENQDGRQEGDIPIQTVILEQKENNDGTVEKLKEKLDNLEKLRKEEKEKWKGEKHALEAKHKEEVDKLKKDINGYEARLEAVLEDGSRKEKMVDKLLDESRIIKEINQSLEIQAGSVTKEQSEQIDQPKQTAPPEDEINTSSRKANEVKEKKVCWHWSRSGRCRFGKDCWFEHPEHVQQTVSFKSNQVIEEKQISQNLMEMVEGRKYELSEEQSRSDDSKNRLRNHQSHRHGHGPKTANKNSQKGKASSLRNGEKREEKRKTKLCWYIEHGDECPYGEERCWFSHSKSKFRQERPNRIISTHNDRDVKQGGKKFRLGTTNRNNTKNDECDPPKNCMKGMQQMTHLHTVYSLVNQLKQQSMDIKELKQIVARRR